MCRYSALIIIIPLIISFSCKKSDSEILKEAVITAKESPLNREIKKLEFGIKKEQNPEKKARILSSIAEIDIQKNDIDSALKRARRAIKLNPNNHSAHYVLAKALLDRGRYDKSQREITKAIRLENKNAAYYFELANIHYKKGKAGKAIKNYKKAISLDPEFLDAYNNLGVLLFQAGKNREAEKTLKKATLVDPEHPTAYKNLGILYETRLKKKGEAINSYKKYLALAPNAPDRDVVEYWISKIR